MFVVTEAAERPCEMPHKINVGLAVLSAAILVAVFADPSVDRRSSMGFMGMRGKKASSVDGGGDETAIELDKRTLVFRRPLFGRTFADVAAAGSSAEGYKRAMGFVGMRGKKEYYKGSSAAGFFGMRGKKVPSSDAFFGMRGKKWPAVAADPALLARENDVTGADVEQAVLVLHRIIDDMRSTDRG